MEGEWTEFVPFVVEILVAIGALFMIDAGNGNGSAAMYGIGMAIFAAACLFGLWTIRRFFDRAESRDRRGH